MSIIERKEELEAFFHDAGKTRERWRVGTEYEKVGVDRSTGQAIPYFGPRGVDRILREMIERYGWEPSITLRAGLEETYAWIREQVERDVADGRVRAA